MFRPKRLTPINVFGIVLSIVFLCPISNGYEQTHEIEAIRIATYNIEHFSRMFDQEKLPKSNRNRTEYFRDEEDLYEVARTIKLKEFDPDILCVQECCDQEMLELFNRKWLENKYEFVKVFPGNTENMYLGILAKKGIVPMATKDQYYLERDPASNSKTLFSRGPVFVKFQTPKGNRFWVGTTHIKSKYRNSKRATQRRIKQITRIRAICEELLADGETDKLVILGDFNDDLGLDEYEKELGQDAISIMNKGKGKEKLVSLNNRINGAIDKISTYHCEIEPPKYRSILDYIFASPTMASYEKNTRIIDNPIAAVASNHYPVVATFEFPASCKNMIHVTNDSPNQIPKNIILMISDGCGYNHIDAASLYQYGKTGTQLYEKFPVKCAMATYMAGGSYDPNIAWADFNYVAADYTDSAAAATAMSTGHKTYKKAVGVDLSEKPLKHIIALCEELGKATGLVTTVQISHATPAGFVAHNKHRHNYEQIANEILKRSPIDVIVGCGHPLYDENGVERKNVSEDNYKYVGGRVTFEALFAGNIGADADSDRINDPWAVIQTREQFQQLAYGETPKRLLGIAQVWETLQQNRSGDANAAPYVVPMIESVPTLQEMTNASLNVLDNDEDGFFLMVEGGAVDWASHANQSGRVIEEEIDFNKAVEAVVGWINKNSSWDETLLIVTGDHECGYLTGPDSGNKKIGPVWNNIINHGKGNQPGMEWHSDDHTNALIPFYAKGKGSGLFRTVMTKKDPVRGYYIDNTDVAKLIFEMLRRNNSLN